MTRIDETRMNLQTRSGELLTQTREAGEGLLATARDEARSWQKYLLGRRARLQRELRTLSSPAALERRALELAAESLTAATARIESRIVELSAMESAQKRAQAKKASPKKRAATKKSVTRAAAPAVPAKAKPAAAKPRGTKRIEFPAPN